MSNGFVCVMFLVIRDNDVESPLGFGHVDRNGLALVLVDALAPGILQSAPHFTWHCNARMAVMNRPVKQLHGMTARRLRIS